MINYIKKRDYRDLRKRLPKQRKTIKRAIQDAVGRGGAFTEMEAITLLSAQLNENLDEASPRSLSAIQKFST